MYKTNLSSHEDLKTGYPETGWQSLEKLKGKFTGNILEQGNSEYSRLSETIFHKGTPALIFQPQSPEDVAMAVQYARRNSLSLSIRSGGHGLPGFATNTDGVIIELSALNKVEVIDKARNIVRVGAGAIWGDVAKKLQEHHLAISSGDTKSVGVGGLTLGGGIGWMVRKYGFTIDNLLSAGIVTSDGRILRASPEENQDLFWAIRGGGGNFCVVTSFDFQAYPIEKVLWGTIQYNIDNLENILKSWRNLMRTADENLNSTIKVMPSMFGNPPSVIILLCYNGIDSQNARNAIEPFLKLGTVTSQDIKEMNYCDILEDAVLPPDTIKIISKNTFSQNFSDEIVKALTNIAGQANSPVIQVRSINGFINNISNDATAFAFRNSEVLIGAGYISPKSLTEQQRTEMLKSWDSVKDNCSGTYVNFCSEEEDIKAIYPETTYNRLAEIKRIYDPKNVFKRNYNIKP